MLLGHKSSLDHSFDSRWTSNGPFKPLPIKALFHRRSNFQGLRSTRCCLSSSFMVSCDIFPHYSWRMEQIEGMEWIQGVELAVGACSVELSIWHSKRCWLSKGGYHQAEKLKSAYHRYKIMRRDQIKSLRVLIKKEPTDTAPKGHRGKLKNFLRTSRLNNVNTDDLQ